MQFGDAPIIWTNGLVDVHLVAAIDGFTILTWQGPEHRLDEWCGSFATEETARAIARQIALMFNRYGTVEAIDRQRSALLNVINEQQRRPSGMRSTFLLDQAEIEYDQLLTLADRRLLAQLQNDMIDFLTDE